MCLTYLFESLYACAIGILLQVLFSEAACTNPFEIPFDLASIFDYPLTTKQRRWPFLCVLLFH